jgi:branched-chain amino acid transport system ATP-binding protein
MLTLTDVHTHYGLSHILQGISLSVAPGEVLGVFGRNGVGKSTLIKAIARWVRLSSGSIRLGGAEIGGLPPEKVCRLGVGLVPEDRRIFPGLTVEENLRLGLMQAPRRSRPNAARALERAYGRFPRLAQRRRQMGTTLSGGEQQMLAIARVLVGEPKLLLVDEPTEGLAPMIVDEIFELLAGLRGEGTPIVLVEQNVLRALAVCDRFCAIERGRVVLEGDARAEPDRKRLIEAIAV